MAVAGGAAVFCAAVECALNHIGVLTWEYPWWNTGPASIIIAGGYFLFFTVSFYVYDLDTLKKKISVVAPILALDALCLIVFIFGLKWI